MRTYYLAPVGIEATLTSVSLGMVRALERIGIKTGFVKPVAETFLGKDSDRSRIFAKALFNIDTAESLSTDLVEKLFSTGETEQLMEEVVTLFQQAADSNDVVIVEGLAQTPNRPALAALNVDIARSLSADVILVVAADQLNDATSIAEQIEIAVQQFGGLDKTNFAGFVLSRVAADTNIDALQKDLSKASKTISSGKLPLLGVIPYNRIHEAPRMSDIVNQLKCKVLYNEADTLNTARVNDYIVVSRSVEYVADLLRPGVLVITAGDRDDILMATSLAILRGVPLAGLLLTSNFEPKESIRNLCASALQKIPVLISEHRTFDTIKQLGKMDPHIPVDDIERITKLVDYVAENLHVDSLKGSIDKLREKRMPPAAFRYQLIQTARKAGKKIVLPEGDEPRTIQAAIICQEKGIAQCILLGKKEKVQEIANAQGMQIPADLQIVDPDSVRVKYIEPMVEMRKSKGLTPQQADDQLQDTVVLATMMVALNEVDGLVSGAVHTTANTIRPALQLIKTAPGSKLVSSVFFMLMPDQVYVYGDCAVNPNPSADELADIAIQSADSAKAFGVADPRVAMISYSTGTSGTGEDVEKVKQATELVKTKRPDITVDGPLQYDAATVESVGRQKSPGSPVAGQANVFVFPDLNTGNTTYKAVQRSANVVSVGPMLQGLRKPVNDLSRGALVDDIVYTIALTAIQATQN